MSDHEDLYEDTILCRVSMGLTQRAYTIDDMQLMKAVMQWERPSYYEFFGPSWESPAPPRPTLREHLLAEGFNVVKVDTYIEDRALQKEDQERRYAELKAEQAKWRYRFRVWRSERRHRIRTAAEVLRGQHECGY